MEALFVFEAFKRGQEPRDAMGVAYKNKQIKSRSWRLLEFIGQHPEGVTFTEIQHFIWLDKGYPEKDFWKKGPIYGGKEMRLSRGYWCTNLLGSSGWARKKKGRNVGLLHGWCEKRGKKWFLVNMPEPGELLYKYE